jgi:hypothetical protein
MPHTASVIINAHSRASGSQSRRHAADSGEHLGLLDTRVGFLTFDDPAGSYRTPEESLKV